MGKHRPLKEFCPHWCESVCEREKNKREKENVEEDPSRMLEIGTDEHFIREPLGTSWL
jgi:hypothetical protein